jgi:LacI family transcriptional regulator
MDRSKKSSQRRRANVNIHDVAKRARVSIATVSRVVNRISTVDPELAKRVWKAVDEVGYVPNTQARALVSGRSRILGLIVSEITNPFFPELVQEFENLAVAQGYEVMIGSTNYDAARTESLIRRMLQRNVDGVAVMTFGIEEELVHKLVDHGFPLVFVDAGPELPNVRVLKVNYGEGIREAVQHLAALGHRQIAFISGPLHMRTAATRRDAFRKAMAELGLTVPAASMAEGKHTMESGKAAMEQLLRAAALPTAVVCSNDMTAIGVLHALDETTHQVPQDISVVGFDDIHLAQFMLPPLTTVQMSCRDLATAASREALCRRKAKLRPKVWRGRRRARSRPTAPSLVRPHIHIRADRFRCSPRCGACRAECRQAPEQRRACRAAPRVVLR